MDSRQLSEINLSMELVYLYKVLHDRGLMYLSEQYPVPVYTDEDICDYLDIVYEALYSLSNAVWSRDSKHDDTEIIYFSHPAMMEYYRLCREYGRYTGVKLGNNPYMQKAAEYVRGLLQQDQCMTCEYSLLTKINHEWASGIVFKMWPEFSGMLALLVMMSRVFGFYEMEVINLKKEIEKFQKNMIWRPRHENSAGFILLASAGNTGRKSSG